MANQLEKFGLRPYRKLDGTPLVGAQNRYKIANGYATAIYPRRFSKTINRWYFVIELLVILLMLLWVCLTDVFIMIQLLKNRLTQITTQVELHQLKGEITAFVVDDPDAVFLMNADAVFAQADLFKTIRLTTLTEVQQQEYLNAIRCSSQGTSWHICSSSN